MNPNASLVTAINKVRELVVSGNANYHQYLPIIDENTDIANWGRTLLTAPTNVSNAFISTLINKLVYTRFESKYFRNPLRDLEGDAMPLGYAGEEIFVNPAKGRVYNVNDFAGLLQKYEADVKVQYTEVNMDLQYPVTFTRHDLKKAFRSWEDLDRFILELSNSLYNGAFINEFKFTKGLVSSAYKANRVQVEVVDGVNSEAYAKAFITKARQLYLDMQLPSSNFNAWAKVGGYGRAVMTWSNPEDLVFLIRNDLRAYIDVNVLASAFNIDKTTLLGQIKPIDNFDMYDDDGNKIFDGSAIIGFIADRSWFKIRPQDMYLDEFYNANNRTWQYYLNDTKMYNYSIFSNGVCLATSEAAVGVDSMSFEESTASITGTDTITLKLEVNPFESNESITFTSSATGKATVEKIDNRTVAVTGVANGNSTITATASTSSKTATCTVTVSGVA